MRRYWASWLRRDSFRQPLILLRRSKRYEYVNAIKVAILANEVLHLLLDGEPNETFDIDRSIESLTKLIKRKRIGWLAHWTAACYFSRAAEAAELVTPRAWEKYERRFRAFGSPLSAPAGSSTSWQECCEEMAIGEIGRVLRNPCNQLNPALFHTDPDMRRLHNAFKAGAVRVLIGPLENI